MVVGPRSGRYRSRRCGLRFFLTPHPGCRPGNRRAKRPWAAVCHAACGGLTAPRGRSLRSLRGAGAGCSGPLGLRVAALLAPWFGNLFANPCLLLIHTLDVGPRQPQAARRANYFSVTPAAPLQNNRHAARLRACNVVNFVLIN